MQHIRVVGAIWLLLALALSGCGGGQAPSAAEKAAATAEKAAATAQKAAAQLAQQASATQVGGAAGKPAAAATQPPPTAAKPAAPAAATKPAAPTAADETFSVASRNAGLEKLKTYRARWRSEWKATEGGVTESVIWEWFEEVARESQAQHWGSKMTEAKTGKLTEFEVWRIADVTYIATKNDEGKQECISLSGDPQDTPFAAGLLSPNTFGGVSDAKYVGSETINGIKTKHYKYDEKAAVLTAFGRVNGEIWVAEDGGYVVKDVVNWQGAAGLFGSTTKANGVGSWTFEVLDVNKPLTIAPPATCDKGKVDTPIMPDAQEKARIGAMTTYVTAAKVADVVKFYREEMQKAGWELDGEPDVSDELVSLNFTRAGATAQITIVSADGKTQVMINATEE